MMTQTKTFNSGISKQANLSYHDYMKTGLSILNSKLSVKTYKRAPKKEYPIFERGTDLRIQIRWDKTVIYEFVVESIFWNKTNSNKEDRKHMRSWADIKLKKVKDALYRVKKK